MEIRIDTHAHTIACGHAYNSIREMAAAGAAKGLQMMAITEHAPAMPGTCGEYFFHNLDVLPRVYNGIPVLYGVELNIMDVHGNVDLSEAVCQKLDIVMASIHPPCFGEGHTVAEHTQAYVEAMKKPYIKIIGHPDDSRFLPDYEVIVKAAKETNTLLEVNNSSQRPMSFRKGARENTLTMLDLCKQYEVLVSTGSDAHVDTDVGNFHYIRELFEYCSFPEELVATTDLEKLKPYINLK